MKKRNLLDNFDWEKSLCYKNLTIKQVIRKMQKNSLRIALIVNKEKKLLGTITDGDVRRGILKNISLNDKGSKIMNNKPRSVYDDVTKKEILNLIRSKDFLHMPIINKNKKVVGLHTLQSLTTQNKFHNPVVLMAGGYGRRLLPLTKKVPKPLIKVADKSIIELIIRHLAEQGFVNFYISTFYKHYLLKKKLGSGNKYGVKISYLTERKPLGTAGSLSLIKKKYKNIPFIVMNADLLTKLDFAELLEFHKKNKSIATVCVRDFNYKIPYGVIKSKKNVLQSIEEKPKINHFVSAGIYILNYSVIKKIKKNQFLNMPTLIQRLINNKRKIFTFPIYEYWNDIGRFINLKKAKIDIQRGSY